jgi:putative addiction module killer protein
VNGDALAHLYPWGYSGRAGVNEVRQTAEFSRWFETLRDPVTRGRILARIRRLSLGNAGDVESAGGGVSEMRIHFGPGYRVYFSDMGDGAVVLLAGVTKRTQPRDIGTPRALARGLREK